jgi:hypothetical protein
MLSNFQISTGQFLQIILSGQPQLAEKLRTAELVQLRQRISILARLKPFSEEETALYIDHRLRTAGYKQGSALFTRPAVELIAKYSDGIPRNINNLCFNALSVGCALKRKVIDGEIIREVIEDLNLEPLQESAPLSPLAEPQEQSAAPQERAPLSPLPEPQAQSAAPAVIANSQASPRPSQWLTKAAVACAAFSALLGVLWAAHRRTPALSAVRANSIVQPVVLAVPPAPRQITQPASTTVLVRAGQTLSSICAQRFGSCNPELLQQIIHFNPSLVDPDLIEDGQSLRIPVVQDSSDDTQSSRDQADQSSFAKRGKQ